MLFRAALGQVEQIVFFWKTKLPIHDPRMLLEHVAERLNSIPYGSPKVLRSSSHVVLNRRDRLLDLLRLGRPHGHLRERHESPTPVLNVSNRLGEFRIGRDVILLALL